MKEIIALIAVFLTFAAYIPYYSDIIKGKTQPHIYSWSLWGLVTVLIIALQIKGGAGPAIWMTIAAGFLCLGVIILSLKQGKRDITKSDKVVAMLSLIAIAFWLIADQPEISLMLVILSDILAFIPTVRKTWIKPYSETAMFYATNALRFWLSLVAIESYTFLSSSWILAWAIGNSLFLVMLIVRRRQVEREG